MGYLTRLNQFVTLVQHPLKLLLLLSVALLYLSSGLSWGDVVLTDQEAEQLDQILTELDQEIQDQGKRIVILETTLEKSEKDLEKSKQETKDQVSYSNGLEVSLKEQKRKTVIDTIIGFFVGAALMALFNLF